MFVFKTQKELKGFLQNKGKIGFVPTMGALHQGHISLIARSKAENEITGCSIFINPTQFNNKNDFDKYPITIEKDISLLLEANCDFLFLPSVKEMYPEGIDQHHPYDLGYLDTILEGAHRPGHFNGVCAIIHKLLLAVLPQNLYMGEKDFQQCMIARRLLEITRLDVHLIICPTEREADGLAKSSRNQRLDPQARAKANTIFACLKYIKENQHATTFHQLQKTCLTKLGDAGFQTEYLELAEANTLELMQDFDAQKNMVVLIASKIDDIRLIDNMRL